MTTLDKIYRIFLENPLVTTDSRHIQKGSMFFALKGDNFDGNRFAIEAVNQGCVAAIVDNPKIIDDRCIYVENVLETLQNLSTLHRKSLGIKILAITGSNGKTTTKELVSSVLSKKYNVCATKGNLNNHIGVPLTLLSLTNEIDIAVVEMGANHPGEIKQLSSIAMPDYGIITNIGRAHLEGFGSFEGVKQTKGELYQYLAANKGYAFYNPNNEYLNDIINHCNLRSHSIPYIKELDEISIDTSIPSPYLCLKVKLAGNKPLRIQTSLVGNYNYENVLAAITVGQYMGISLEMIKEAIEGYTPSNSRSQLVKTNFNTVILDAYNANPSSMEVSIRNFSAYDGNQKVVIIGEMLELGDYSAEEHKRIAKLVKSCGFYLTIFVGRGFKNEAEDYLYFPDSDSCLQYLKDHPIQNSLVLLKGSRGVKLEKVMERL
ncbi:MAG: UDP-N-acetylmuramoyl-tripeptide--D-alanyl-D-alanine ligase [Bacteroidales bacterium]|nr:UDP-N-acetylmuramoyl-tripeptide--D-alanyl-D-alanine ligase [Bacteroidales bacterium]